MTPQQIIEDAAAFLANPDHWCKHRMLKFEHREFGATFADARLRLAEHPESPGFRCCLGGALILVANDDRSALSLARRAVVGCIWNARYASDFNDAAGTIHADVMTVLRRAPALA